MSGQVKILGVTLDSTMTLDGQIAATCRSSYMHIRRINTIRQYLTNDAVKALTQSLVTSRLDYCNIIYNGLPMKSIKRLQFYLFNIDIIKHLFKYIFLLLLLLLLLLCTCH